jgi:hypothetical protein
VNTGHLSVRKYIIKIWRKVREVIITSNIFENVDKPNPPEEELCAHRKWTRVYIVILILIIGNIVLFTTLIYQMNTIIINKPTLDLYRNLPYSAVCPCTNLSIPYHTFIDLNASFHDVCSSVFIQRKNSWITILHAFYQNQINKKRNIRTFQDMAFLHFQALQIICDASIQTVKSELDLFLNSTFVSVRVIELNLFEKQINITLSNLFSHRH